MTDGRRRGARTCLALVFVVALSSSGGCGRATRARWTDPPDPLMPMNRVFFGFNMALDRYVAGPISVAYSGVIPKPFRHGIRNFFRNLTMPFIITNDLLQGRAHWAGRDTVRFLMNTTVGFGGIVDPASDFGFDHRVQNFGITAGRWGSGPGPYLVIPLFGPMSLVGVPDIPMRALLTPVALIDSGLTQTATRGVEGVSESESRKDAVRRVREAVEPYSFMKSGYMQRQWSIISEGKAEEGVPFEPLPEDVLEEEGEEVVERAAGEGEPAPPPTEPPPPGS